MKKIVQPTIRKIYGQAGSSPQDVHQMNTAKKINSLLSSGAVSVTGPGQPRILKQRIPGTPTTVQAGPIKCYVCDEPSGQNGVPLAEARTSVTSTDLPSKIGTVVGDGYWVIHIGGDMVCKRCVSMFNHMDRLEHDLDRVKVNILALINNKYGIDITVDTKPAAQQPPAKLQRLNTNLAISRKNGGDEEDTPVTVTRKLTTISTVQNVNRDANVAENQLANIFDSPPAEKPNNVMAQIRQHTTITQVQQGGATTAVSPASSTVAKKVGTPQNPTKIYKCMSCDFKTMDLKQFQPHYETCKQQSAGYRCKICRKLFTNMNALKTHTAEKHSNDYVCSICSVNYVNESAFKRHMETNHPDVKTIESSVQPASNVGMQTVFSCNSCSYKTSDRLSYDDHMRKHKVKPFKCRLCSSRFETREMASVHARTHQPDYFKCGKCAQSFQQRDLLMKHFETHKKDSSATPVGAVTTPQQQQKQLHQQQQQQQQQQLAQQQQNVQQDLTTQKLLQETIDEALRDTGELDSKIHFFSCNICSLTFIQENYYNQHMETHKRDGNKKSATTTSGGGTQASTSVVSTVASTSVPTTNSQSLIRQDVRNTNATILHTTQTGSISDADIESMFEKMHSDKVETEGNSNSSENLVITSQASSGGGISFSITIPQQEDTAAGPEAMSVKQERDAAANASVGIDMPVLETDDQQHQHIDQGQAVPPVSMPSLDDDGDGDSSHPSNTEHIPMDLEDMQNSDEGGQIKFILNEDGQLLQLDNHIITTDAEGNQILVQGTDSEQIQQLLQSVGVLQAGEGDGETFQMIQGENNQMIIVQGDNNQTHMIDASMLNEDGHLVIQQQESEEASDEMHMVNAGAGQGSVSISFADNEPHDAAMDHQEQQEHHEHDEQQQHEHDEHQQMVDAESHEEMMETDQEQQQQHQEHEEQHEGDEHNSSHATAEEDREGSGGNEEAATTKAEASSTSSSQPVSSTTGEVFFNLEDLMQQPEQK